MPQPRSFHFVWSVKHREMSFTSLVKTKTLFLFATSDVVLILRVSFHCMESSRPPKGAVPPAVGAHCRMADSRREGCAGREPAPICYASSQRCKSDNVFHRVKTSTDILVSRRTIYIPPESILLFACALQHLP